MRKQNPHAGRYKFIGLENPEALRHTSTQRTVRSHAALNTRRTRHFQERRMLKNFRTLTVNDMEQRLARSTSPTRLRLNPQPANHLIDPFATLPASCDRFQELVNGRYAKQAAEPIFTFEECKTPFRSSTDLYQSCFCNPAFMNALMLSLIFAENRDNMSTECWTYRGEAMRHLGLLLQFSETIFDETTIGAILILTGVDYRIGNASSHATHMSGISRILDLWKRKKLCLNDHTIRSIFWQDLNGAMISGCSRLYDHETFLELQWSRAQISGHHELFILPPGFQQLRSLFCNDMITVFEDLNGFRILREEETTSCRLADLDRMKYIDNAQAWNESRLCNLQATTNDLNPLVKCCLTAAYICSYSLFSEIWHGSFITSRLSTCLLEQIRGAFLLSKKLSLISAEQQQQRQHQKDLFLWLVYIGAAFSTDQETRLDFISLLQQLVTEWPTLDKIWGDTVSVLRGYVWSDTIYYTRCFQVWTESQKVLVATS